MGESETSNWQESLTRTYEAILSQIIAFSPQLIGALALLTAGWLTAHALRLTTKKLILSFDSLSQRVARIGGAKWERMKSSYAVIVSKVVFWAVILFFIAATGNMLGWGMFSNWMNSIIVYLPHLFMGLLIILMGYLLGNVTRAIIGITNTAGLERAEILARFTQIVIYVTALLIGIEQIGINMDFLTNILIVVVGVLFMGAALAFSFGAKTLVANFIGAQYVRKHCRVGEQMKLGDIVGNVVEVTQTSIVLETEYGRTIIPAKHFQEQISSFKSKDELLGDLEKEGKR